MTEPELEEFLLPRLRAGLTDWVVDAKQRLPYAAGAIDAQFFEVDILVREKPSRDEEGKPRVVVELKAGGVNTHDLNTYSKKAELHRSLNGYLRYGLFVAGERAKGVTAKWLWHGRMFDFMLSCGRERPRKRELDKLIEVISHEVRISRKIEKVLSSRRGPYPDFFWRKTAIGNYG